MDKTKAAIKDFMSRDGKHDTTVHEQVAPAVKHETVKQHQHEVVNTAVDKEVHQDHYHHTVQPIHDKEVLAEQHHHNLGAVEHREFDHRDHDHTKATLAAQAGKFQDKRVVHDTTHSQSEAAVVQGEHVHHHLHEVIQPVIHKEVIQPSVVHTTVPIHEVHHNTAQHHETSALPAVTMEQFTKQGGVLGGRGERTDAFEGCPQGSHSAGGAVTGGHTHHEHSGATGTGTTGLHTSQHDVGHTGVGGVGNTTTHHNTDTTQKKPSLLDRLNPMKDTDHDGKKGVME